MVLIDENEGRGRETRRGSQMTRLCDGFRRNDHYWLGPLQGEYVSIEAEGKGRIVGLC